MPGYTCQSCDQPMLPAQKVCPKCGWVRPSREETETDIARMILFGMAAFLVIILAAAWKIGF